MQTSVADYFITLSNELAIENNVIIITSKIRETNIRLNNNITVLKWPSKRPTAWKDFWFLARQVKKYKPSLMISLFGSVNLFLIVGSIFGIKNRVAWIRTLSSQYPQKSYKVFRKSIVYRLATNIITNSIATKKDIIGFFKVADFKITVLPNSVKDYSNALKDIETDHDKILYVGRLHPSKGIDVLLNGFSQLVRKYPKLHLDIIGHGHMLNDLVALTSSLAIQDKVSFLGEKNRDTVFKAYKKSYCTVIPSYSEAFGFVVIEAMSTGTCVIGANNTGIKEIIIDGKTGLLFETGNADDLAKKISTILADVDFRNNLASSGYERYINNFETGYAVHRDALFFNQLMNSNFSD
jgi:glycosyltransferase involved in cell wall biosynthesis